MHVIAAPESINHLQDNPELVCRVMIGLAVFFETMSFIFKTSSIINFTQVFFISSLILFIWGIHCLVDLAMVVDFDSPLAR
jgi:hypothetical protein